MLAVPLVRFALIRMPVSEPWSPDSAVPSVSVTGIVTAAGRADVSVAVTVTDEPSRTGLGLADSDTAGMTAASSSSSMVTRTDDGVPAVTFAGRFAVSSATVNVSLSVSSSLHGEDDPGRVRQAARGDLDAVGHHVVVLRLSRAPCLRQRDRHPGPAAPTTA